MEPSQLLHLLLVCTLCSGNQVWIDAPGSAACQTDADCSYLGVCSNSHCLCDPGWTGPDCGILLLEPAVRGSGYNLTSQRPPTSSWGANILRSANNSSEWHMYAAEFEHHCDISAWSPNSAIVHAVSSTGPLGPYKRQTVAVEPFAHNPKVIRHPDGTYLMYTIGVNVADSKLKNCTGNDTVQAPRPGRTPQNLESNVTLYTSNAIAGPWERFGKVLGPDWEGSWDEDTSNPSPWVLPNGTVLLMYRGCTVDGSCPPGSICGCSAEHIGLASAPDWRGPYTRHSPIPILANISAEDPSMWLDTRGHAHMLFHYISDPVNVARHAFAPSVWGPWSLHEGTIPYTTRVEFDDDTTTEFHKRERPHIVFDAAGLPMYFVSGVVSPKSDQKGYQGLSYTLVQQVRHVG